MGKGSFKVNRGIRTIIAFFILWELVSLLGFLEAFHIPSPFTVLKTFFFLLVEGVHVGELGKVTMFKMAKDSLYRVCIGFLLALAIGFPIGFWMGWNKTVKTFLENMYTVLRPLPPFAWVPLSLFFLGPGNLTSVFVIWIGAFFPISLNTMAAVENVEKKYIRAALTLGLKRNQLIREVVIPAALPGIFTGIRIGLGMAWGLVVAAELVAVKTGLGALIWRADLVMRPDIILAGIIFIGLIAYVLEQGILWLQRGLLSWQKGLVI